MMTAIDLANLVVAMRCAQRRFFGERSSEALVESKRLEKEVDAALIEILGDGQVMMFRAKGGGW